MIRLNLTTKELEELLEQYYLEHEGIEAKVSFRAKTSYVGVFETKSVEPRIAVEHKVTIMGSERVIEETKEKDEIIRCLNTALAKDGYAIENIKVHQDNDRRVTSDAIELNLKQISKDKVKTYK